MENMVSSIGKIRRNLSRSLLTTFSFKEQKVEIHIFCDSSGKAYAAVAYVRCIYSDSTTSMRLLKANVRLAPISPITIPRLELQSAVMGTELCKLAVSATRIPLKQVTFWSDSQNVLCWLKNDNKLPMFVANRKAKILRCSESDQWKWVDTKNNPADIPSRGMLIQELSNSNTWWHGPEFLQFPNDSHFPLQPEFSSPPEEKEEQVFVALEERKVSSGIFHYERYSEWKKLVNAVKYAISLFMSKLNKKRSKENQISKPTFNLAEKVILKDIQQSCFFREFEELSLGKNLSTKSSIFPLRPFLFNGLICSLTRLSEIVLLDDEIKYPIILPKNHYGITLLIRHYHEVLINHGMGVSYTLSFMNKKYWVINGRSQIFKVLRNCVKCKHKRLRAKPCAQILAPLPKHRIPEENSRIFDNIAVDAAGPFYVTVGRASCKRYVLIFSCMTYRGVHFEVLHSVDTDSFLLALDRFVSTRGLPCYARSDNGTNFKGGISVLSQILEQINLEKLQDRYPTIKWEFAIPYAPHSQGIVERMVGVLKNAMYVTLSEIRMNDEIFLSLVKKSEGILNSRPLTYVSTKEGDLKPLTPAHFIAGKINLSLIPPLAINGTYAKRYLQMNRDFISFMAKVHK